MPVLRAFLLGLLLPFGFAPFHMPGVAIISLASFYYQLQYCIGNEKDSFSDCRIFLVGLCYGLGFFGFGVSWVYVSIHDYGHLNGLLSAFLTFCFVAYLSLFPALTAVFFKRLTTFENKKIRLMKHADSIHSAPSSLLYRFFKMPPLSGFYRLWPYMSCLSIFVPPLLFSAIWVISEYARATFFTGFPWLLIGFGQYDAPSRYLLPWVGTYGVSFFTCFCAAWLARCFFLKAYRQYQRVFAVVIMILFPFLLASNHSQKTPEKPITVAVIQANLSMRDKWDELFFNKLLLYYQQKTMAALGAKLIVMPESAIPLPFQYLEDFMSDLHLKALDAGSAVLFGIPKTFRTTPDQYFNALMSLGMAKGFYLKQHLVPFGEYVPTFLQRINHWFDLPDANLLPGSAHQRPVFVHNYPIASLICYELAYGDLLRKQLPYAAFIVSISDAGWFGHSFAMYQQQQMAQVLSLETGRYQIFANNDGLSSVIDAQGNIQQALPAFKAGVLRGTLQPLQGITPWVRWGDQPILSICWLIASIGVFYSIIQPIAAKYKRRYSYQPR